MLLGLCIATLPFCQHCLLFSLPNESFSRHLGCLGAAQWQLLEFALLPHYLFCILY